MQNDIPQHLSPSLKNLEHLLRHIQQNKPVKEEMVREHNSKEDKYNKLPLWHMPYGGGTLSGNTNTCSKPVWRI